MIFTMNMVSTKDALPKESGKYICLSYYGTSLCNATDIYYSAKYNMFNVEDFRTEEEVELYGFMPSFWCENSNEVRETLKKWKK